MSEYSNGHKDDPIPQQSLIVKVRVVRTTTAEYEIDLSSDNYKGMTLSTAILADVNNFEDDPNNWDEMVMLPDTEVDQTIKSYFKDVSNNTWIEVDPNAKATEGQM